MARTKQNAKRSVGLSHMEYHNNLSVAGIHALAQDDLIEEEQPDEVTDQSDNDDMSFDDEPDDFESMYCVICHNGGGLINCDICHRDVCTDCLGNIDITTVQEDWHFLCPSCHVMTLGNSDKYHAFHSHNGSRNVHSEPSRVTGTMVAPQHAFCSTAPVVILSFRLKSLTKEASIPDLFHMNLNSYFWNTKGNLQYFDIPFNFETDRDAAIHSRKMEKLCAGIMTIPNVRVVTFIYTHSNVQVGDLYHASNAASSIEDWFTIVLTEHFKKLCHVIRLHYMFILACGAIVNKKESLEALREQLFLYKVPFTLGFTTATLNAHLCSDFVGHFATRVIVELAVPKQSTMCKMLGMSFTLRRHSSVVVFRYEGLMGDKRVDVEKYVWHHPKLAPAGHPLPYQCPICKALCCLESRTGRNHNKTHIAGYQCINNTCTYRCLWEVSYDPKKLDKEHGKWYRTLHNGKEVADDEDEDEEDVYYKL
ncbi:uncharacterized protein B0H18DRAFT_1126092 [Fomitopsis serialis]|uniref:uncharacterized protein n=1 Tax=Fomitopsis serialis TaxID=139415 RepID=UPI0020085572|nr:uncharacterized protein B0H18DRAFT_1126092 [Neoantrodia serialis]KAH9913652.1 hypothetical protein B0H18DRAFT_1126092 [Neoantrodia serialis]